MRKHLLFFLCFISLNTYAQNNEPEDVLNAAKVHDGVYRTFLEFRTNSPSLVGNLEITKRHVKILNKETGKYEKVKESFWGACLDDQVYVFYEGHLYPFEVIDRYSYFIVESHSQVSSPSSSYSITTSVIYVININNGRIYALTKKVMEEILQKDEQLFRLYKESPRQSYEHYLLKYNWKHQNEIKPISELMK